ncbi:uncharacterized protein L3040_006479 [Drepanopeziza brunnea f. sp. 'multigermtubi']|uniref:Uncharacterized protein n=1 Tax=Marssonina brunnea f. sp. multigermtubi (strain MB_m1) TaxID=1072389 RepID=K1X178_MARBU|nr:uncharacterized protein MBM_02223 [Drepanopeziza brunnea f. sp. 'multigermtubi' MB_m1]EKD18986.1 hypothetical protein MBM_02223 [Drepanopeziza brunnea f. sp. 'multigermtubi' MB_m1]KAJ5038800.1 hypothetical protein L3040_006479 [Drepanopeziza brunnea f. sp. 'multigermtubi']
MNEGSNINGEMEEEDMEQSEAGSGDSPYQAHGSHADGINPPQEAALDTVPDTSDETNEREESLPENAAANHSPPKSPRSFTFKVGTKRPLDETSPTATEYSSPYRRRLPSKRDYSSDDSDTEASKLLLRDLLPHEIKLAHILYRRYVVSRFLPAAVALKYWIHQWKEAHQEREAEWQELLELHETPRQRRERLRVTAFHESAPTRKAAAEYLKKAREDLRIRTEVEKSIRSSIESEESVQDLTEGTNGWVAISLRPRGL